MDDDVEELDPAEAAVVLLGLDELRSLLEELASTRPDVQSPSCRNARIQLATETLSKAKAGRQLLASMGKELQCSSLHAAGRCMSLFVQSIIAEQQQQSQQEPEQTDSNSQLVEDLCRGLALQCQRAQDPALVDCAVQELLRGKQIIDNERGDGLIQVFYQLAICNNIAIASVALGSALDLGTPKQQQQRDWLAALLQTTTAQLTPAPELRLAQAFIQTHVSIEQWTDTVLPALQLKLKSHPDRALSTVLGWIQSTTSIVPPLDEDWIQLLLKHLTSSAKEKNRTLASQILLQAAASTGNRYKITQALSATKPSLAPARVSLYETLEQLARTPPPAPPPAANTTNSTTVGQDDMTSTNLLVDQVLTALLVLVPKEPKAEHRALGQRALVAWLVEAKQQTSSTAAYKKVLSELIQKPVQAKKANDACALLSAMVQYIQPDRLKAMASDLWMIADKTWDNNLETLFTTAATKKSAQVDALLVVYFALLHAVNQKSLQVLPSFISKCIAAGATVKGESFLYTPSLMEAVATNEIVSTVLPRVLALYTQLVASGDTATSGSSEGVALFSTNKITAAARALTRCVLYPTALPRDCLHALPTRAVAANIEQILTYHPTVGETLVQSLMQEVQRVSSEFERLVEEEVAAAKAFQDTGPTVDSSIRFDWKGTGSSNAAHRGFEPGSVRFVARVLSKHCRDATALARVLILLHMSTSLKTEGRQRTALILNTLNVLREALATTADDTVDLRAVLASEIMRLSADWTSQIDDEKAKRDVAVSDTVHRSGLSLLTSLGGIASNFSAATDDPSDPDVQPYMLASRLCTDNLAKGLAAQLQTTLLRLERLTDSDMDLYESPFGSLVRREDTMTVAASVKTGGKRLSEEEEWELQMKKELAEKKKRESDSETLTAEDKKMVEQQDLRRREIALLLDTELFRVLDAVRSLCLSDIEVGNECLSLVSKSVLAAAVSSCPAVKRNHSVEAKAFETLTALATCVYEIHEVHAPTLATALLVSCRSELKQGVGTGHSRQDDAKDPVHVSALPSPCAPAACVVYEMDNFHDALSGASFAFLFPVIQASLMGPRTPPGCEAALRVLERHTELLSGETADPAVIALRKDMVASVLNLLKYDRAQTFQEPTALEALVSCFRTDEASEDSGPALTTAELAPLLDERGALGPKNCRIGSMVALTQIAKDHRKLVKANLLIENRIWLNCFEKDEDIRLQASKAWATLHNLNDFSVVISDLPSPSPLYATPLLPLLSHKDPSIAQSAADAFAHAMAKHSGSVGRNVEVLCKAYIESFPASATNGDSKSSLPLPVKAIPAASAKKKIATGIPKVKSVSKKSALDVAGIGKPKPVKKKTAVYSALLKPKQERTLDQDDFANQFKTAGDEAVDKGKDSPAKITTRLGVLRAIAAMSNSSITVDMDEATLKLLTSFLMAYGIADCEESVKGAARDTLRDVVASNGGSDEAISFLLPHLEAVLRTGVADEESLGSLPTEKVPKDSDSSDRRKEGAVVALGSVAIHLKGPENDEKVASTVDMLVAALKTPSEEVQNSVADALTKLMKKGRTQERIESILLGLLKGSLSGQSSAVRRGAAHGLSAAVKGSGITTLKKYEIVKQLDEACASGGPNAKEGSLFAIELLSNRLGLLFEPYVIVLLPSLLKAFSDSSDYVRKAANNTAGLIMSKLSAHGVKLVMPAVLTAFDDPAWRTKQASIHMLGAMSHLAPKQLASALPKVVPQLTEAFSDTHPKVKASAQEALNEISTVVKNPEISSISAVLLKALTDPADYTIRALEELIATEFLHAIDAPSLSLIVPILHRGLRDRGATTKRYSGLIAGNICTMINDPKDLVPYLPTLLPDLQSSLLDPIPDVRSTSAKALGSLTRSLGDHILLELRPWLIAKLRDGQASSAERSGAAQGLTEVLIASGSTMVEDTMRREILPLRSYPDASTREGVLWMLTFLPPVMGQGFTPLIDVSLPALINGLSDDSEPVRDVALRAGRVLIRSHGKVHVDKILPSLEAGLSDDDHRIRVASLSLLGDLLSMIGGTQVVKGEGETQEDIRRAERAQAQIALVLGSEARKRVLSGLYLARSDSVHMVRQSAVQVWKTVVSVTARALRDILGVLVNRIITDLASGHEEKTDVAARCLGDLVSKLGDSVLPQIIPVLRNSLAEGDEDTRRGVCVGLTDVIKCSTKEQIIRFIEIIVKVIQDALSDEDELVRKMAAGSFESLHAVVGSRAMDEIIPSLMVSLESGEEDERSRARALNGLTGILAVRSRELLPYIIPRLIQRPMSTNRAQVLAGVARVTGSTIHYHFSSIIPALIGELADLEDKDSAKEEAVRECSRAVCGSVESIGVSNLISEIASKSGSDKAAVRRESCRMYEYVVTERASDADFYEQIPIILREIIYRLNDSDAAVLKANNAAFSALSIHVPAEELVKHVEFIRNLLASIVSDARRRKGGVGDGEFFLPGFNMPKGLEPLMPIYQRGILYGSPAIREVSASGLGEAILLTPAKFLAGPLVVKMTGPLLRIVGDRNPSNVKIAILKTLGLVLLKGGPTLRAFVPQFQTTFVKALSDPSRQVRREAIEALSLLMPLSTRVDPLIKELVVGSLGKSAATEGLEAAAVQTATLEALAVVLDKGGEKAKLPASIPSALDASKELLTNPDEGIREASAKVIGMACSLLGMDVANEILAGIVVSPGTYSEARHGNACAIRQVLTSRVGAEVRPELVADLLKRAGTDYLKDDKNIVREAAFAALGAAIGRSTSPKNSVRSYESDLLKIMRDRQEPIEIHRAVACGLCTALLLVNPPERVDFMGLTLMDACLELALKSTQRVQFAFNDVLWLALNVAGGQDGLDRYCELAVFDNQRAMKSLHSKILARLKGVSIL